MNRDKVITNAKDKRTQEFYTEFHNDVNFPYGVNLSHNYTFWDDELSRFNDNSKTIKWLEEHIGARTDTWMTTGVDHIYELYIWFTNESDATYFRLTCV